MWVDGVFRGAVEIGTGTLNASGAGMRIGWGMQRDYPFVFGGYVRSVVLRQGLAPDLVA